MLAFLTGAALTIFVQSSVAVTVVMIAFQKAGLFGQAEAIISVYGANVGSSVLTYILSAGLTGVARQVALYLVGSISSRPCCWSRFCMPWSGQIRSWSWR